MNTIAIVQEIDDEISRLRQVRELLSAVNAAEKRKPGRPAAAALPKNNKAVRALSTAARENIAAAQKKRWAKVRRAKKAALKTAAAPAAKATNSNNVAPKSAPVKKSVSAKKSSQAKPKPPVAPTAA
ncbi:MAG TPA: hypothetical protein VNW54_05835 [Granulicella sp.]|jgi:hypothetical protein|nr:hypothetical protein [Granulicella sp.]